MEQFRRDKAPDRFLVLLREYNRQRVKSLDEALREEVVSCNPVEAYESLIEYRQQKAVDALDNADCLTLGTGRRRAEISKAKWPFLRAIKTILNKRCEFWPLSDRQIHYALLNDPPLIHASKPQSHYANTFQSYKALSTYSHGHSWSATSRWTASPRDKARHHLACPPLRTGLHPQRA